MKNSKHEYRNSKLISDFGFRISDLQKVLLFEMGRKEGKTSSQHGPYVLGYTHTTMAKNNELQAGNGKLIAEISPQFRSGSEIRPREAGIGSNRESAGRGEYVLGSCTQNKCALSSLLNKVVKIHP